MEWQVERVMQVFKTGMGRRVSKDPEKTFVNDHLLRLAMLHWIIDAPQGMKTYEELSCQPSWDKYDGE